MWLCSLFTCSSFICLHKGILRLSIQFVAFSHRKRHANKIKTNMRSICSKFVNKFTTFLNDGLSIQNVAGKCNVNQPTMQRLR